MWDWIVNILFVVLQFIQQFAVDWGLSIIILVLIVRIILTPLLLKSTKATARMQVLQPKMMEIQEKYADDPQRQAEELQKFYSENKFNPFGGCLPLLIQMPILLALFTLLRDLPKYFSDHEGVFSFFNILPDLTASPATSLAEGFTAGLPVERHGLRSVEQIAARRRGEGGERTVGADRVVTRQTGAQAQSMRMMSVVMTLMMLFVGWGLPAGVLLYYDVSTLWQVVQQLFVTQKVIEKAKAEEEERMANAPIQVDVVRRERKPRPHKKS